MGMGRGYDGNVDGSMYQGRGGVNGNRGRHRNRVGNRDRAWSRAGALLTLALEVLMFSMFSMLLTQLLGTLLQARRM